MRGIRIENDREGMGAETGMLGIIASIALAIMVGGGCASSKPTEHYPFPVMLDPVTEATPHVHVK